MNNRSTLRIVLHVVVCSVCLFVFGMGLTVNAAGTHEAEIPPLRPPLDEVPSSFLEKHGGWLALALLLTSGAVITFVVLTRRKVPAISIGAAEAAKAELMGLAQATEDGVVLTKASRSVKHYFAAAFGLGTGELTTREFLNELHSRESLPVDLRRDTADFLVDCDRRKFSPAPPKSERPAVPAALELIDRAEKARIPIATPEQRPTQPSLA